MCCAGPLFRMEMFNKLQRYQTNADFSIFSYTFGSNGKKQPAGQEL